MATLTSQLILSLIDKVTAPARGIAGAVNNLQGRLEANNRQLDAMRGRMVETVAVGYGLYRAIRAPVMAAMEFESAMADVRKVVDFPTPAAFKDMSAQIIEMSTQIPIAATGIADIVAAAGQAGMAGDELLAFTEIAAKVGVAFDMTAGEVGTSLAKIKTQLNLSVADTGALADAINHLSNTSASAAPDIIEYMKSVAATGGFYGFTATQTAALGSAMIAAGAEANVAATSFRNVGRALAKGGSATTRQSAAFQRLGLDVVKVAKSFNEDAVGTLRDVIVRINALPEHLRANTLSEIFGDEARALAPLITQIELYDKALASVADRAIYLGSSQKEYEVRSETTANAMQLFSNKVTAAGIAIGSALLPALNSVMDALGPVALAVARFADANPRLTSTIVALTAGLVALRVAAIAAQFSFLWMKGAALASMIGGLKLLRIATLAAGGALTAIALAGLWIYNNWKNVSTAFDGFRKSFAKAMKPVEKTMEPILEWFGEVYEFFENLVGPVEDATGAFEDFGRRLGTTIGNAVRSVVQTFRDLPRAISNAMAFDNIGDMGSRIATWLGSALNTAWSRIRVSWDWASKIANSIADSDFVQAIRTRFDAVDWSAAVSGVGSAIGSAIAIAFDTYIRSVNLASDVLDWLTGQINSMDAAAIGRSLADMIVKGLSAGIDLIGELVKLVASKDGGGKLAAALGSALASGGSLIASVMRGWFNFGYGFWSEVLQSSIDAIRQKFGDIDLLDVGRDAIKSLLDGMKAKFGELLEWARGIAGGIREAIGPIDLSGAAAAGAAATGAAAAGAAIGGMAPPAPVNDNAIDGARAAGGPIAGGRTYLVGEEGPELITPSRSGYVHSADETEGMMALRRGSAGGTPASGSPTINLGGINVYPSPGMDETALAQKVAREIDRTLKDAFSGGHWNGGYRVA